MYNDQNVHCLWAKTAKRSKHEKKMFNVLFGLKCPQVIWRCPMTKVCIFLWAKTGTNKNCPKSHVQVSNDHNWHFLCTNTAKRSKPDKKNLKTFFVVKNIPKSHFGVSNNQNLRCLCPQTHKFVLSQMPPKVIWRCPMNQICIFCGP